jgi:hypothetical protein
MFWLGKEIKSETRWLVFWCLFGVAIALFLVLIK